MKKIVLIVAILLSLMITCIKLVYAETSEWARIVSDEVYLYADETGKQKLFQLAKSYYVNVIGRTNDMYQVAVMPDDNDFVQVIGWAYISELTPCASMPVAPVYPTVKLTVTADSVELKLSPVPSANTTCAVLNMQQVCYYGKLTSYSKTWYYVRYAGRFGYVEASAVTAPNLPLHPTPLPNTPASTLPSTDNPTPPENVNSVPTSEILLIVFVVVLAVGLTLALFLPGNVKKRNNIFEQDI